MDIYRHDESFRRRGYPVIAGLDEAGRGPLAGPVVAAAVILPDKPRIPGLRDSKKVPEKERERLFWDVVSVSVAIGVGVAGHEEIDATNILKATKRAMESAVRDLRLSPDLLIIDAVALPTLKIEQVAYFKAESKSAAVASASIVAKYVRDAIMIRYDAVYPQYDFGRHKGYATSEHLEKIRRHGPCPIHRKTFEPVMSLELPF
jgi:ribonuclease HII